MFRGNFVTLLVSHLLFNTYSWSLIICLFKPIVQWKYWKRSVFVCNLEKVIKSWKAFFMNKYLGGRRPRDELMCVHTCVTLCWGLCDDGYLSRTPGWRNEDIKGLLCLIRWYFDGPHRWVFSPHLRYYVMGWARGIAGLLFEEIEGKNSNLLILVGLDLLEVLCA